MFILQDNAGQAAPLNWVLKVREVFLSLQVPHQFLATFHARWKSRSARVFGQASVQGASQVGIRPPNNLAFMAVAEAFLARNLGGRYEPIGDAFEGSSVKVPVGAADVPGLAEKLK